jgi:nuclear receptor subfamily 1 group F protein 4
MIQGQDVPDSSLGYDFPSGPTSSTPGYSESSESPPPYTSPYGLSNGSLSQNYPVSLNSLNLQDMQQQSPYVITPPDSTTLDRHHSPPHDIVGSSTPNNSGFSPDFHISSPFSSEMLTGMILEAHQRTCMYTAEQVITLRARWNQSDTKNVLATFHDMSETQIWIECAKKLTEVLQQIIEFAKGLPGFMNLCQEDQIALLKSGSFEVAVLRISRCYDPSHNIVLFGTDFVPIDAFQMTSDVDSEEFQFITKIFEFVKSLIDLGLTESELALFCAAALMSPDRLGIRDHREIRTYNDHILSALKMELQRPHHIGSRHPAIYAEQTFRELLRKLPILRSLSSKHIELLTKFKRGAPSDIIDHLPPLHHELFPCEITRRGSV